MRSARASLVLLVFLISAPLAAQGNAGVDIGLWGSWATMGGGSAGGSDDGIEVANGSGFGVSVRFDRGGRLSTELAVFSISSAASLVPASAAPIEADLGSVRITPLSVTVHLHLAPRSMISPWVGGGLAYVVAGELGRLDPDVVESGRLEVDDEITYVANAGFDLRISPTFAVGLDTRYVPFRPASRGVGDSGDTELRLSPWIVSIGARFRF
jgi:outer membrane protein W